MRRAPYGFDAFETCHSCNWRTERFFCALPPDALEAFDRTSFINVYPEGSILFAEGQQPRGISMICRGSVKLSVASGDGKTLIIHVAHAGEALGLSSSMTGHDFKSTAETLEPTQVRFIKREDFVRFLSQFPEASRRTNAQLAEECEAQNDQIRAIGLSHSAAEKLAHLILTWCTESGRDGDGGTRVQLLMTHQDIAQLIGTSRETVTRLLKEFREKKIISVKGSTITVHSRPALEALVTM